MFDARHAETKPIAVLGAGKLVSHLHRDKKDGYVFNVFRVARQLDTSQVLTVSDLPDVVKLCQVLAFAMCDDGWLSAQQRDRLLKLNEELDEVTRGWSDACHE